MAIDKIEKKLSNIPLLRKRITVNPTIQADKDDFMDKYETTNDHLAIKTVDELNQIVDAIDITTTQIDTAVTIINTQTETAITKANEASESASEAEDYKNQAEAAVASLPVGTLNDSIISLTTTWSSQEISNELSSLDVSPLNKPVITSPISGTTDYIGIITSTYSTSDYYEGLQTKVIWECALDETFNNIIDSYEGSDNLTSWTPTISLPLTQVFIRTKQISDGHRSDFSDAISFTTPNIFVQAPTLTIEGEITDVTETPTITLGAFSVYNGTDTHKSSSYRIKKAADNTVVHENLDDETNLLSYKLSSNILEVSTSYVFEAWQTGDTYGDSTVTSKTITTKSNFRTAFGRIWNTTDDVYRRWKDGISDFSATTELEFSSWLSPSAARVNDNDTDTPSDLTTELDTNTSLPFANMARKVVTTAGSVTAFDHTTAPAATEQIMTQIEQTYYIQALVTADSKEYDIELVSKEPFSVDVVSDLGLTNVTNIAVWNPTTGISSGTVSGNIISSALHPAFMWHDGNEADFTYIGSFPSITGKSTFGADATSSITRAVARTQNSGFGTDFAQHDFWNQSLLQILAYIERGSNYLEGSNTKWAGYARSGLSTGDVQNTGLTLSLEDKTGVIKDGSNEVIANSYRGIENYHSNLRMWVDGINLNGGVVHLAKAGASYADDTNASPYFDSGYTTATSSINIDKWLAGTFIPNPVGGGDSTTQVTDYAYGSASGWKVLASGGYLSHPGNSGLSYWDGTSASSHSAWHVVSRSSFRKFLA